MIWFNDNPSKSKITAPPQICVFGSSIEAAMVTWTARKRSFNEHFDGFHLPMWIKTTCDELYRANQVIETMLTHTSTFDPQNTRTIAISDGDKFNQFLFEHVFHCVRVQIIIQIGVLQFQFEKCANLQAIDTLRIIIFRNGDGPKLTLSNALFG